MTTMMQILMIVTLFQMMTSETDDFEFGEPWHTKNLPFSDKYIPHAIKQVTSDDLKKIGKRSTFC